MWQQCGNNLFPHFLGRSDIKEPRILYTQNLVSNLVAFSFNHHLRLDTLSNPQTYAGKFRAAYIEFSTALRAFNLIDLYRPESNSILNPQAPDTKIGSPFHYVLLFPALLGDTIGLHLSSLVPDVEITAPRAFTSTYVMKQLIEDSKWCPYTLKKLHATTRYSVLYWLWASGFEDLSITSHSACNENACKANRVSDESSYPILHVMHATDTAIYFV
jgi:hypothetical protein